MNRKTRRTIASLSRRQKWSRLSEVVPSVQFSLAVNYVSKLSPAQRRMIGKSSFALRHEEHRRGMVLLGLYG